MVVSICNDVNVKIGMVGLLLMNILRQSPAREMQGEETYQCC